MRIKKSFAYFLFLPVLLFFVSSCNTHAPKADDKPLTESEKHLPENALRGLKVADGLEISLFAHEPMLSNPTNIDVDEKGRVWVCEAFNYRNKLNPQNPYRKEGDRILILEDTDGDGKADKQTVFYQGTDIDAALGISVLGNKVIVSVSPNVFVFTDKDGDGKADSKEILFTGIGGIQHDHAIHAFNFGPDGKYYFNFGNAGDSIETKDGRVVKDPDGNIVRNDGHPYRQGMVFRCNPDGSDFEVMANNFRNNYEVAEDSYGTMWQSDNDDDGNKGVRINYVMPYGNYGYTDEMTGASWPTRRINMEDSIPYRHWHLNDPGVVPNLLQTGAGSPTGILVYEGDLLPEIYRNQLIHADAGPNVVRSYSVKTNGSGYTASINNIVEGINDNWFRPSDVCIAPDGSLFISDWYDPGVGGHQVEDLSRGRIFRVASTGSKYMVPKFNLDNPDDAAKALESPNLSTRFLAYTKLESQGDNAISALDKMFHSSNSRMRARALWLLARIPSSRSRYIGDALKDGDENIRITGLRAALEFKLDTIATVKQLIHDPSPQVKREAAIALRHNKRPEAADLWAHLAAQYDGKDRWYLEAIGIAADGQWDRFFETWVKTTQGNWQNPAAYDIIWRSRTPAALSYLSKIITDSTHNPEQYLKFFRAFDFHPESAKEITLMEIMNGNHPQQARINSLVLMLIDPSKTKMTPSLKMAINKSLNSVKGKQDYLDLLKRFNLKDHNNDLLEMAQHGVDAEIRSGATRLLLNSGGEAVVWATIRKKDSSSLQMIKALGGWEEQKNKNILQQVVLDKSYPSWIRIPAAEGLARGWSGEDRMLALAKSKQLPDDVKSIAIGALSHAYRPEIREEAAKYLNTGTKNDTPALPSIDQLVTMKGEASAGTQVFNMYCSTCHQVNGKGVNFGPALSEIGSKLSKEAIYNSIIHPSAGISFGYDGFVFKLKNGTTLVGYIASETSTEISIKQIGGNIEKHLKSEIAEKKPYGASLMPEGLAQVIGKDQLVNLVEYLQTLKKK